MTNDINKIIAELKELDLEKFLDLPLEVIIEHNLDGSPDVNGIKTASGEYIDWDGIGVIEAVTAASNAVPRLIEHIEGLEKELQESANRIFNARMDAVLAINNCPATNQMTMASLIKIVDTLGGSPRPQKESNDKV